MKKKKEEEIRNTKKKNRMALRTNEGEKKNFRNSECTIITIHTQKKKKKITKYHTLFFLLASLSEKREGSSKTQ